MPAFVCLLALAGLPAGPLHDDDRAALYRGGGNVPLPIAALLDPTATPSPERTLLNVEAVTVTPAPLASTSTAVSTAESTLMSIPAADRQRARARSGAVYAALWEHFYLPADRLFRETAPYEGGNPYAFAWPLSQTFGASNDMAALPDADPQHTFDALSVAGSIERYFDDDREPSAYSSYIPPPDGYENDRFYDDNAWIGLELLRAYELTGYDLAIERAGQIFDFLVSGWDSSHTSPRPGGVFWVESQDNQHRNTVSTAPSAKLGLLLAEREEDPARRHYYLEWSKRMYDWVDASLRGPDGLYWDHIDEHGTIDTAVYTYNQGSMLGASLLLYRATDDERYLDRAEQIGRSVLRRWDLDGLLDQPIAFNAILFHDLLQLNDVRPDTAYLDLMIDYSNRLWSGHRNPATNLITGSNPSTLLDQAGAVRIFAMLAGYDS